MIKMSDSNFIKKNITKSPNSFAHASVAKSTNTFAKKVITKSNQVMSGDNTASAPYGGDFGTFGSIYGEENYGGISHFKNRTRPPGIAH